MKPGDMVEFLNRGSRWPKIVRVLTVSPCGRYVRISRGNGTKLLKASELKQIEPPQKP